MQNRLTFFTPSKNRAAQLDLLFRSIKTNFLDSDKLDFVIVYKWTTAKFGEAYQKLIEKEIFPNIQWVPEQSHRIGEDFNNTLESTLATQRDKFIGLFTDDCIFYRRFTYPLEDILNNISDDVISYSMRLGLNTVQQNYVDQTVQPSLDILGYQQLNNGFIKWSWRIRHPYMNYGYPFSLDGCIYRANDLSKWLNGHYCINPRDVESYLINNNFLRNHTQRNYMVANAESCVMVNTSNVTQYPPIQAGVKYPVSLEEFNTRYLQGEQVKFSEMDFSNIQGCHDEIPVVWGQQNRRIFY